MNERSKQARQAILFIFHFFIHTQSPCEIKRREVNWILTKKLECFCWSRRDQEIPGPSRDSRKDQEEGGGAGPSRDPRRDQEQGGGAAGFRKMDLFCFSCSSTAVLRTLSS